jgi:ferredoxin-NADP reductase
MLHASLSAALGSLFVLLAGANVWVMLHASSRSKDHVAHGRLMRAHRLGGYAFILLFCVFLYFMALRIKGASDELPPRLTFHFMLALLLIPILLVKVLIARYYRHYSSALLFLGVTIFALSFTLVAMNLVPYLLGRAASAGAPAPVSVGFVLTTCSGLGFLLLRRPRQPTPAGSRATPNDITDGLAAGASRREIRRRRSSSLRLQLARIDVQTHDTKTLRFLVAETDRLSARPGQFLTFQWQIDGKVVPRSYSISSSPTQSAYLEITPKRVPDGHVSAFLNDRAGVGLEVEAKGPFGQFYFDEGRHQRIVLLAGGSGITPMMSMLRYIDDRCLRTSVTLIYCVRTRRDVVFEPELTRLRRRLREFRLILVLSQPDAGWNGPRGRVSRDLIATRVDDLGSSTVFLCGPPAFMESMQGILKSLAVRPECINRESFGYTRTIGGAALEAAPPLQGTVEFARAGKVCDVPPGKTLLEVAEMHGVNIPSGCRQGRCGACVTKLLEGDVQMDAEDGLEASDKAEGYILMCVGRPRGDVKVDA